MDLPAFAEVGFYVLWQMCPVEKRYLLAAYAVLFSKCEASVCEAGVCLIPPQPLEAFAPRLEDGPEDAPNGSNHGGRAVAGGDDDSEEAVEDYDGALAQLSVALEDDAPVGSSEHSVLALI